MSSFLAQLEKEIRRFISNDSRFFGHRTAGAWAYGKKRLTFRRKYDRSRKEKSLKP
jgi:hypothetical protein